MSDKLSQSVVDEVVARAKQGEPYTKIALDLGISHRTAKRLGKNAGLTRSKRGSPVTASSGESHTMSEWSKLTGVSEWNISIRLRRGWSVDEAVGLKDRETPAWGRSATETITASSGECRTIAEWSSRLGGKVETLMHRLDSGWSPDQTLGLSASPGKYVHDGKAYTLTEIAEMLGMSREGVKSRIRGGWTIDEILATPKDQARKLKVRGFEFLGQWRSLKEWSVETGISYPKLLRRFNEGQSPKEILREVVINDAASS